ELARLLQGHVLAQRDQQGAEPDVAGAGRVDAVDLVSGNTDGGLAVVEVAAFDVELDADQAGGHGATEGGEHFLWVGFARQRGGFGAAGTENVQVRQDRIEQFTRGGRVDRVEGELRVRRDGAEFLQQSRQVRGQVGQQTEVADLNDGALFEGGETATEGGGVEQGRSAGDMEEAALPARFDGDDRGGGLRTRIRDDARDVQTHLAETIND